MASPSRLPEEAVGHVAVAAVDLIAEDKEDSRASSFKCATEEMNGNVFECYDEQIDMRHLPEPWRSCRGT